MLDGAAAFF